MGSWSRFRGKYSSEVRLTSGARALNFARITTVRSQTCIPPSLIFEVRLQDRGCIGLRYDAAWLELYGSNSPFDFLV